MVGTRSAHFREFDRGTRSDKLERPLGGIENQHLRPLTRDSAAKVWQNGMKAQLARCFVVESAETYGVSRLLCSEPRGRVNDSDRVTVSLLGAIAPYDKAVLCEDDEVHFAAPHNFANLAGKLKSWPDVRHPRGAAGEALVHK